MKHVILLEILSHLDFIIVFGGMSLSLGTKSLEHTNELLGDIGEVP